MASNQIKHAIGIFHNRQTALQALNELKNTGFPMQKISVIAKSPDSDELLAGVESVQQLADSLAHSVVGLFLKNRQNFIIIKSLKIKTIW